MELSISKIVVRPIGLLPASLLFDACIGALITWYSLPYFCFRKSLLEVSFFSSTLLNPSIPNSIIFSFLPPKSFAEFLTACSSSLISGSDWFGLLANSLLYFLIAAFSFESFVGIVSTENPSGFLVLIRLIV